MPCAQGRGRRGRSGPDRARPRRGPVSPSAGVLRQRRVARDTRDLDGGVLMNQAIHMIDLVRWIGGPVASVVGAHRDDGPRDGGRGHGDRVAPVRRRSAWVDRRHDLRHTGIPARAADLRRSRATSDSSASKRRSGTCRDVGRATRGPTTCRSQPAGLPPRPGARMPSATSASTATSSRRSGPDDRRRSPARTAATPSRSSSAAVRGGPRRTGSRTPRTPAAMKVGAARVDITPPLGCRMDGFESRTTGATGVHDPLHARVLVAEGDDGTTVALVVADLLQIEQGVQDLIADSRAGRDRDPARAPPAGRDAYPQRSREREPSESSGPSGGTSPTPSPRRVATVVTRPPRSASGA